jgi:DNA-binding NtrC family response regulator
MFNRSKWKLCRTYTLTSALAFLQAQKTPVALCEDELLPGTWRDLLRQITCLPYAPTLIVSSRLADDRLWAEALNLGVWDVLARPFDRNEVFRSVSAAWRHWKDQHSARFPTRIRLATPGTLDAPDACGDLPYQQAV